MEKRVGREKGRDGEERKGLGVKGWGKRREGEVKDRGRHQGIME